MKRSTKMAPDSLSTSQLDGVGIHGDLDDHIEGFGNILAGVTLLRDMVVVRVVV